MIDSIYFGIVEDFLANATEEEKRQLVNSHRALVYFYLNNGYCVHRKDFELSVGKHLQRMSVLLNDTAKEVGLEDNETYYPRIIKEMQSKHVQPEENKELVEELVPIGA